MVTKADIEEKILTNLNLAEDIIAHMGKHAAAEDPLASLLAAKPELWEKIEKADNNSWSCFIRSCNHLRKQSVNIQLPGFNPEHYASVMEAIELAAGWIEAFAYYTNCPRRNEG